MENLQSDWDEMLLQAWEANSQIGALLYQFCSYLNEMGFTSEEQIVQRLQSLNLKRVPMHVGDLKLSVRAFIGRYCLRLNACLFDKKNSRDDILAAIDNFKWRKYDSKSSLKSASKRSRERQKEKAYIVIKVRERDKRRDWNTVK